MVKTYYQLFPELLIIPFLVFKKLCKFVIYDSREVRDMSIALPPATKTSTSLETDISLHSSVINHFHNYLLHSDDHQSHVIRLGHALTEIID